MSISFLLSTSAFETRVTHADFVGFPYADPLAYWVCGSSFCVHDSTIHPFAVHGDRIGCLYAPLPLLSKLPGPFGTVFLILELALANSLPQKFTLVFWLIK